MFARLVLLAGAVALSASAQTPGPQTVKPPSSGGLCQQIATAAFQANRRLSIDGTREAGSAPFVSKWLVQRALAPDANGSLRQIGRRETCPALPDRCHYLGPNDLVDDREMDIPGAVTGGRTEFAHYAEWYSSIGLLPANGEFLDIRALREFGEYTQIGPAGAFIKSALDRQGMVCAFDNRLHETYSTGSLPEDKEADRACAALLSDDTVILKPDPTLPPGLSQETFRAQVDERRDTGAPYYGTGTYHPDGILKVDVDNDGTEEMLVRVTWSGNGDRCQRSYYDVLDSSDPSKLSSAPLRSRLRDAQGTASRGLGSSCNTETRIRRKGNRVLLESSGLDPVQKRGEPVVTKGGAPLERVLREISGGEVRHLCSTQFAVEPVIVYAR